MLVLALSVAATFAGAVGTYLTKSISLRMPTWQAVGPLFAINALLVVPLIPFGPTWQALTWPVLPLHLGSVVLLCGTTACIFTLITRGRASGVAVGQALAEPGNVGTLIRVSDALGADAVWLTEGGVDPENTKAVRASAGSLFHLPVVRGIAEAGLVSRAHALGLQVAVATAHGEVDVERADDLLARPTAWVFGNEAHGVPAPLVDAADLRVRIPIRGRAESLNIVTAASICLHTSARVQAARS